MVQTAGDENTTTPGERQQGHGEKASATKVSFYYHERKALFQYLDLCRGTTLCLCHRCSLSKFAQR